MRNVVLVDMDNTLVNWDKEFAKRWAALRPDDSPDIIKHRKHFELEQNFGHDLMPVAIGIMSTPGFFAALEPQPGAIGAIREMLAAGLQVILCTAPHPLQYETCVAEKYGWVRKWLGESFLSKIVITRDKTIVKGRVLIDDKPAVKGKCDKPDWEHVVFEQPYNLEVDDRPRMKNWAEWKAVLRNYFEMC
ncbi:unnamed protein product [Agarophyton chilense]